MTLTVDLVIVGMTDAAAAAAIDAVRRGQRVLVVGESKDARYCRTLRRTLEAAGAGCPGRLSMLAGFDVVAVDGIDAVEVVLVRNLKTCGLFGINADAMLATTTLAPGIVAATLRVESEGTPPAALPPSAAVVPAHPCCPNPAPACPQNPALSFDIIAVCGKARSRPDPVR